MSDKNEKNSKPTASLNQANLLPGDEYEFTPDYVRFCKTPEPGTYSEDLRWDRLNLTARNETSLDLLIRQRKKREEQKRQEKSEGL